MQMDESEILRLNFEDYDHSSAFGAFFGWPMTNEKCQMMNGKSCLVPEHSDGNWTNRNVCLTTALPAPVAC
ncbi:MAG: hypothetical protein QOF62_3816 [Pyrinomonadaceae bacterium]|jgi:hypothetical protein|nr:hypothetical protein [Pyrinomonadaceae bacterium]